MQGVDGSTVLVDCPTRLTVEILADKWSVLVLFALGQRPRHHGELVDQIGGISRKVLTHTLRRLQQYGLVERHTPAPRQVTYALTELGQSIMEPIDALTTWARAHGGEVTAFQQVAGAAD